MLVRRWAVARDRSSITSVNRVLTPPVGYGGTSAAAWDACAEVESTASSRPCWISSLAVWGTASLGSCDAVSIKAANSPPVWLDASTTRDASAP